MFRPNTFDSLTPPKRRGNTLIVTLLLLGLLSLVAFAAVFGAKDLSEYTRNIGQAVPEGTQDNGVDALNAYLSSFIYDQPDSGQGLLDATRGHSLMATMYSRQTGATTPWNGIGTFGATNETVTINSEPPFFRSRFVNHRIFNGQTEWYDPEHAGQRAPNVLPITGTFIPKNAAYTYPDIKDFYLAAQCPATGEILVPSYHRPGVVGSLNPAMNPNWTTATAGFQTPRPTPFFHPNFPPVPANADGSYTGDVQNLQGAYGPNGSQRNESIWIDIGLPAITLPNGKRVKQLVAPLILDLDGRLNLNAHGNRMNYTGQPAPNDQIHASGAGLGTWEVDLSRVLGATESRQLVRARASTPRTYAGSVGQSFSPYYPNGTQLPQSSAVPWAGFTGASANPLQIPGVGNARFYDDAPLMSAGTYSGGYDSTNALVGSHPALYNAAEWMTTPPFPRAFPVSDTKLLSAKYAFSPFFYSPLEVGAFATPGPPPRGAIAPNSLKGSFPVTNPNPPAQGTTNGYRRDPAHRNRQLFTTRGCSLDLPGLMPGSSEIATGQYSAVNAAIGGIDLNRSLADYRVNPRQALSPGNIGNAAAADADRQRFAMDIFARLIVAAGIPATDATANPGVPSVTVTIFAAPLTAQYNVLRSLAQLSANIVDYIDSDDISTRFVWNAAAGAVGDSTVFGVEKPRLVLSEVYSELTNDPNGPDATFGARVGLPLAQPNATSAAHVRFWLELQNPTSTAYVGGTGPLGSGAVNVRYTAADGAAIPYSVYTVEIVQDQKVPGNSVADYLRNPLNANNPAANVTGSSNAVSPPALIFDFSTADAMAQRTVSPANGNPAGGMVICAANVPMPPGTKTLNPEFNPAFPNVINGTAPGMAGSLTYTVPLVNAQAGNQQHVVMLRRLANPYLIESPTNPYITVDTITNVRTADRLLRTNGSNTDRPALPTAGGFESDSAPVAPVQDQRPQSTGKVQPYAAWAVAGTAVAPPRFPQSLVLFQDPAAPANGIRHTFGRQNSKAAAAGGATYIPANPAAPTDASLLGNESLMAPYDWLVHLDRPLINPTELLHVSYGKPHELTLQFITPNGTPQNAGADINKFSGSLQTVALTNTIPQLYRALDLLRIQPYGNMTAAGGRLPGRINLNTIQDKRVWDALFDAQIGNGFTQADVDTMWTGLMQSRTLNLNNRTDATGAVNSCPIPGSSVYDTNTNAGDRPFLPFGVANVPAVAPGPPPPPFYAGGSGIGDTVLRGINPATGLPWILTNNGTHPYQKAEALRKIWNNTTTVSHSFAVWVTVGYFEVESETPSPIALPAGGNAVFVRLGKEYYDKVPGDMRHKFFAIVDRSNVTLQPIMPPAGVNPHFASRPFFTTLEGTAAAGTNTLQIATAGGMTGPQPGKVYSDNVELTFGGGSQLVVGIGANQEVVTIDPNVAMGYTAGYGITTVTLTSPLVKHHAPGESVSNARPGNPGPQPGFDVNKDMYKPVVPHWSRIKINE